MRALVIDPYRNAVYEKNIPKSLKGLQSVVHGLIQEVTRFPNGDILYVNDEGEFHFDPRFGFGNGSTLPGFGVVVGSVGPEHDQGPALSSLDELRSCVQFFIPIVGLADIKFEVGKPTNLAVTRNGADGGSVILLGGHIEPQSVMIVYKLSKPTLAETETFKAGLVEAGVSRDGNATVLSWRFTRPSDGKQMWFETPFHMGLQEAGTRYLLPRETRRHGRLLTLVLQDENAVCRAIRTGTLAPEVSHAMEEAVIEQVIDAATDPAFRATYDVALQRYFARTPDPKSGFDTAPVKGPVLPAAQMGGAVAWVVT